MLRTVAVAEVASPAAAPARNDPDFHDVKIPAASRIAAAIAVDT
jgi:hypothetical protein